MALIDVVVACVGWVNCSIYYGWMLTARARRGTKSCQIDIAPRRREGGWFFGSSRIDLLTGLSRLTTPLRKTRAGYHC